jgi:hypothetical protein
MDILGYAANEYVFSAGPFRVSTWITSKLAPPTRGLPPNLLLDAMPAFFPVPDQRSLPEGLVLRTVTENTGGPLQGTAVCEAVEIRQEVPAEISTIPDGYRPLKPEAKAASSLKADLAPIE